MRSLLWAGVAGPVVFVGVLLVDGSTRTGYDPAIQYVSLLELGDRGWLEVLNFLASGVLIATFGLALRRTTDTSRAAWWMAIFVTIAGLALAWMGLFLTDPALGYPTGAPGGLPLTPSLPGALHLLGGAVVVGSLAVAGILSAARLRGVRDRRSRAWVVYSLVAAGIILSGWAAGFVVAGPVGYGLVAGLVQRLTVIAGMQWLVATAIVELRRARRRRASSPQAANLGA